MKKFLGIALALFLVLTFSSCDQLMNIFIPKVQLSVTQPTGGYITVNPNKTEYTKGETVTITATAMTGYTFSNWTGGYLVGTVSPQTLTLNSDASVSAVFTAPISQPTFSPTTGSTLSSGGTVTIASSTSGATIRYTTDGTSPTSSSAAYTGPIAITATTTIKAIAISGSQVSDIASATFYVTASVVSTPTFSPSAGTYTSTQNVTISCSTSGASIIYTTDGTTPSYSNGYYYYSGNTIPVSQSATIKAFAYKNGMTESSVATAAYTINLPAVEAPQFYPSTGTTFNSSLTVYISSNTSGASIRYTTDNTTPTSTYGTAYTSSFSISATTTVKAIAYVSGGSSSSVTQAVYTKNAANTTAPTFTPLPGYYTNSSTTWTGTVTLSAGTASGTVIRYTTDGTDPTSSSTTYSAPFAISGNVVVKAYASSTGNNDSSIVTGNYYVPVATPKFMIGSAATTGGSFTTAQSVTISTDTVGANIRYTTDGSTPSDTVGTLYSGSIYLSSTTTLKAVAYKPGNYISSVASAAFTFATTGTVSGTVRDASASGVLSGVTLTLYNSSNSSAGTATSSSSGTFSFTNIAAGTNYKVTAAKTGYLSVDYTGISVTAGSTNNLETIYLQSTATLPGSVSGYITNASTGYGETGVTVALRSGIGTTTGTAAYTATTGTNGLYSLSSVTPATYTASISKTGFTTSTFTITVVGNTSNTNQNSSITPNIADGNVRFVLTWGASPYDLDSHLKVPLTSTTFYHVYYADKGSQTASPYATLDVDDTSSYGPETTTIYTQLSGTYTYYVHDFSDRSSTTNTLLSSSGAKVVVYKGSTTLATYYVPSGTGTLWKVCSWNGYSLTPINTLLTESDPSNVQNRSLSGGAKPAWRGQLP
jgi:hypothetical protein